MRSQAIQLQMHMEQESMCRGKSCLQGSLAPERLCAKLVHAESCPVRCHCVCRSRILPTTVATTQALAAPTHRFVAAVWTSNRCTVHEPIEMCFMAELQPYCKAKKQLLALLGTAWCLHTLCTTKRKCLASACTNGCCCYCCCCCCCGCCSCNMLVLLLCTTHASTLVALAQNDLPADVTMYLSQQTPASAAALFPHPALPDRC